MCICRARAPIQPGEQLLIALRYMATGEGYRSSMRWNHRVAHNTISIMIRHVCKAIYLEYRDEVWTVPSTPEGWKEVSNVFSTRWNFHNCVGALDGKHIAIKKPANSGSRYYNYKGFTSIVLMAAVDGNYSFLWCSVGHPGSSSDAGIFNRSSLSRKLQNGTLGLPPPEPLPNDDRAINYHFVGDDAFPLERWLMKPYPMRSLTPHQRIFNYRMSRARRIVENGFGITALRWRCMLTTMQQVPTTVTTIVKGCLTLHNVHRRRHPLRAGEVDQEDGDGNIVPGAWRQHVQLTDNRNMVGNRNKQAAKVQRNYLSDYYNSAVGAVAWQDQVVRVRRVEPQASSDSEESEVD
jgi:hypothetical protein